MPLSTARLLTKSYTFIPCQLTLMTNSFRSHCDNLMFLLLIHNYMFWCLDCWFILYPPTNKCKFLSKKIIFSTLHSIYFAIAESFAENKNSQKTKYYNDLQTSSYHMFICILYITWFTLNSKLNFYFEKKDFCW